VDRFADAAAQRLGVGAAVPGSGGRDHRSAGRQGAPGAVRPEITWRAQPHATFKLLFNGIYFGNATASAGAKATEQQR